MSATFECEDCIGMAAHGCYCAAIGATQPGGPLSLEEEPYPGYAPCPDCYESCGFNGYWHTSWDDPGSFQENPSDPCRECHGTGWVECELISQEDLERDLTPGEDAMIEAAWQDYRSRDA